MKLKKEMISNVRELRDEKNMTQQELADAVGVSLPTIYYLEKGRYNPKLTLSFKLAQVLDHSVEEIFTLKPIISGILGNMTMDEVEEVSEVTGMSIERIFSLKNINDEELTKNFKEEELRELASALGHEFEFLFQKEEN